jgi:signal transduction histidine kinase
MLETLTEGIRLMNTMRPDVEFSMPFEENIQETTFDPDVMQRVVANIFLNASKYSPADETVQVSADMGENNFVRISITDKGPGVPKEYYEKILRNSDRFN